VQVLGEISVTNESKEKKIFFVKRYFDGIGFLWQTPETRYLLKLILVLFSSMIVTYTAISSIVGIYGETQFLIRINLYVLPFFAILLIFILIELIRFYQNARKYTLYPEKNRLLKMKYWHYPDLKDEKRRFSFKIVGSLIFVSALTLVVVTAIFDVQETRFVLIILYSAFIYSFGFIAYFLIFVTSFISARGSMQGLNTKYSDKLQQKGYWFFLFLPLPWVLLIGILFFAGEIFVAYAIFGGFLILWWWVAIGLYGFLSLSGILTILKKSWRVGYTTSQIAASLTFLMVVVIPGIIGIAQDELGTLISLLGLVQFDKSGGGSYFFLGPITSLIAVGFLYIKGALDKWGDNLREYYVAWDKKLKNFNITSEADIKNQTYDKAFDKTPLTTDVPNAYPNLIFGLIILLLTLFGIIFETGAMFAVLGPTAGVAEIEGFLFLNSFFSFWGIILGLFVYTIIIAFRKQQQEQDSSLQV
jgi:hypothetical protein